MKLFKQIEETKREMGVVRPRSQRRTQLEMRLRDLRLKQLRSEIRMKRRRT